MLPPAAYVAIHNAIGGDLAAGCSAAESERIAREASVTTLGSLGGRTVILASVSGSCICGNVNCPYLVLRLDPGGAAKVLLSTYAYEVVPAGAQQPLPNLRERAHNSALVSDETIDAYRNGAYAPISNVRVRGDTGERKPLSLPLRFAPGASSAPIAGRISAGWSDDYELNAARGQQLTLGAVHGPADLTFSLVPAGGKGGSIALTPGKPASLPVSGTYHLSVDTGSDEARDYRATVTIR
jgi:hypothetical protein